MERHQNSKGCQSTMSQTEARRRWAEEKEELGGENSCGVVGDDYHRPNLLNLTVSCSRLNVGSPPIKARGAIYYEPKRSDTRDLERKARDFIQNALWRYYY
jgi:hypothetical protein